ncbi:DUF3833 family protein [Aliikangiella sp. IMCC44632]
MRILTLLLVVTLSACSINEQAYKSKSPKLDFADFFNGNICAWGLVKSSSGQVERKFIADIVATQQKGLVVLDESFEFDDGEKQTRVWTFSRQSQTWIGTAGDVVGKAKGNIFGDSLHLTYVLDVATEDSNYHISMDDWLHLIEPRTLMGTTQMTKWGINVGSIQIVMRKLLPQQDCLPQ